MFHKSVSGKSETDIRKVISSDQKTDLHIHTCYSDGELTPQQVVDRWCAEGYKVISITDHDGIEGSVIGMDYSADKDIVFISGIEFDSHDDLGKDLHMLGYGFDYNNPDLRNTLMKIVLNRAHRNDMLMQAIRDLGYEVTFDDIGQINEGRYIGKPTFAKILYSKGYTGDPQEAFRTIFREPSIRKITKSTLCSRDIIDLIHTAGGIAVFAHPMEQRHLEESYEEFEPRMYQMLDRMREYGVDGIECFHPSADSFQQEILAEYAYKHGLLITRGSDFHSVNHRRNFSRYHRP